MDVLNQIAQFSKEQYLELIPLDPTYQIISNNDGAFNRNFSLNKDPRLATYLLNNPHGEDVEEIEFVD